MGYEIFSKYVLRVPLFSFSSYKQLTENEDIAMEDIQQFCENPIVKEALFLASPSLYSEFEKWLQGEIIDSLAVEKMTYSILKYISRMSSRCTPFGLFAGTSVGSFSDQSQIVLQAVEKNKRHTRLDMNYLVALSQDLVKKEWIRDQLLFYPNTTIYKTGSQVRYVEYTYENSKRVHHIIGVEDSEYLQKVLKKATKGILVEDLARLLVAEKITFLDAKDFIAQLITNQLLISELEPSVSGAEFLDQMLLVLKKIKGTEEIVLQLETVQDRLLAVDQNIGNDPSIYLELSNGLKTLGTGFDLKYMFQTDMHVIPTTNHIDIRSVHKIRKAIRLLNKISLVPKETLITKFQSAFYERYGYREVPLSKALDIEIGIGFLPTQGAGDISTIIDDLVLPVQEQDLAIKTLPWSPIYTMFQKKIMDAMKEQTMYIRLSDQDVSDLEENWDDLPDTMSSIAGFTVIDGKEKIILSNASGSSAANLLGRFCHGDKELQQYTQEIVDLETRLHPDKIMAEIVHLPESRVGNILMRPSFRKYEIPYLAKAVVSTEYQLPLDDLMISITADDRMRVRSKKYNKEVIPRLTNAHNFSSNALPIYQFLATMQTYKKRGGIAFDWGPLAEEYEFLPKVEYHDVIIAPATWNITVKDIKPLLDHRHTHEQWLVVLNEFMSAKKLPRYVLLIDGDNELLITMSNRSSVKMLLDTVKKRTRFTLREFLYTEAGIVKRGEDSYTNQVIVSFYNAQKLKHNQK